MDDTSPILCQEPLYTQTMKINGKDIVSYQLLLVQRARHVMMIVNIKWSNKLLHDTRQLAAPQPSSDATQLLFGSLVAGL
jgi:hypothetical protein